MASVENLKIVRLSTGEELLAEVVKHSDANVELKNPVRIIVVPNKADPQNPSVAFAPFMQWTDDKTLLINTNHVITTATPIAEFVNQYNSMFGGIVVPQSKLIVPQ